MMTSFADFEQNAKSVISSSKLPGFAAIALNASGTFNSTTSVGHTLLGKSVSPSSPMYIASMGKLVTSIAALQLVERGLLSLDVPISDVLPEFRDLKVLAGFDQQSSPILVEPTPAPSLRHLLTHSSGFTYPRWGLQPTIDKFLDLQADRANNDLSVRGTYMAPLAFHPGTSWSYGAGIDFAGLMVVAASGMSLQSYFEENIVRPLRLTSTVFANHLDSHPDIKARLLDIAQREGVDSMKEGILPPFVSSAPEEHGGASLVSSMEDYVKILQALLVPGKLLGSDMLDEMFKPQLGATPKATFQAAGRGNVKYTLRIGVAEHTERTWGLGGGLVTADDAESGKKKGTLVWSGLPNMQWFVNRDEGLAGVFGMQLLPADDKLAGELGGEWGKLVRDEYRVWKATHV